MMKKLARITFAVGLIFIALGAFLAFYIHYDTSKHYQQTHYGNVSLRELPYPYTAAVTLCSDIDSTNSLREFLTIQEFLNTTNDTVVGKGIGLEIGNSFFPVCSDKTLFSLMSANPHDREVILDLIHLGYIDSIHSFNSASDRQEIQDILRLLTENNCKLNVWVNHARAPSDLGPYKWCLGDDSGASIYHADISRKALGYIFVWTGDVSSVLGQGRPLTLLSFFDAFDSSHPFQSLKNNVLKEFAKYVLAIFGSKRYSMRRYNELVTVTQLDNGQKVFKFMRSGTAYFGIGKAATADGLADILTKPILEKLATTGGYMIIYTHLGKNHGYPYLSQRTREALRSLEQQYRSGNIYVTTTARLLTYYVNKKYLQWHVASTKQATNIYVDSISDPVRGTFVPTVEDLMGITFYTDRPEKTHIFLAGREILDVVRNGPDHTGKKSVMIKIHPLTNINRLMTRYHEKGYF